MSVRKEASGRRSIQVEVEVPGTPEEVWLAIATGPGVSSWFVPAKIEEKAGGAMSLLFGPGMESTAVVKEWKPPHHFAAESKDLGPDAPPMATEWFVEARAGGICVVRVVHSLFASTDDWDNQLGGMESGWPTFFRILRLYMTHFRGLPCTILQALAFPTASREETWKKMSSSLGLDGLAAGQKWKTPKDAPSLSGTIEVFDRSKPHDVVLGRLDQPTTGVVHMGVFSCGGPTQAMLSFYYYGNEAAKVVARDEPIWNQWMSRTFPAA